MNKNDPLNNELFQTHIKLRSFNLHIEIKNLIKKILYSHHSENELVEYNKKQTLSLERGFNDSLYDKNGNYKGSFISYINNYYQNNKERLNKEIENVLMINLSDDEFCLREQRNGKNIFSQILNFELFVNYVIQEKEIEIGSNDITNWMVLNNVVIEKSIKIPANIIERIRNRYCN